MYGRPEAVKRHTNGLYPARSTRLALMRAACQSAKPQADFGNDAVVVDTAPSIYAGWDEVHAGDRSCACLLPPLPQARRHKVSPAQSQTKVEWLYSHNWRQASFL